MNQQNPIAPYDEINALRIVADFVEDARRNGAKQQASISTHTLGLPIITVHTGDDSLTPAEFAAWQLASRSVWETTSQVIGKPGIQSKLTQAVFVFRGVRMQMQFVVNLIDLPAVA